MDGSYEWVVSILAIWKVALTGWDCTWAIRVLVKCSLKQTLSRFVTCATVRGAPVVRMVPEGCSFVTPGKLKFVQMLMGTSPQVGPKLRTNPLKL
jgi:hypothetical protein